VRVPPKVTRSLVPSPGMIPRYRHLVLIGLLVLALPASAAAQSSEDTSGADQYTEQGIPGGESPSDEADTESTPAPAPAPSGSSSSGTQPAAEAAPAGDTTALPRTGSDTGWLALTAMALLGGGLLLRRGMSHQPE
jgi:LPXTG-motif cell wall-anchored protein